jgi:N-acetylglucosamine-6-phosphate deacetylase
MHQVFTASAVITPDETLSPGWVLVRDGAVEAVGVGEPPSVEATVVGLQDQTLAPGFVDVHVHGGGGFSLLSGDAKEAGRYLRWVAGTGVTSVLPAVCAVSASEALPTLRALGALAVAMAGRAEVLGLNLEGPFVSRERQGALPISWAHPPDRALLEALIEAAGGALRLMTCASEVDGASEVISAALAAGVRVAVGHTDADYDEAAAAFRAGATHVTHALNAMRPFHHRDPGVIGAALDAPGVTIEVIADGIHLHPATVGMLLRAFGPERVALVTDAVTPAGLDHGTFRIGYAEAVLRSGRITLADGTIAGSAATMDSLVRNVVGWGCATLPEAVRMASTVPAGVAGAGERKGRLAAGCDADIVALSPELSVVGTWVRGARVFPSNGPGGPD